MNGVAFITFIAFLLYLFLGIYGLKINYRARLNQLLFLLCLACAVWAFCIALMFVADDKASAWFWFRMSSPGWAIGPPLILRFCMFLTHEEKRLGRWLTPSLIYLPGLIFTLRGMTLGVTASDIVYMSFGWSPLNSGNTVWYWLYTSYYLALLGLCVVLVWKWGKRSLLIREKMQAKILVICTFLGTILASINESFLPAMGYDYVPKLPVVIFLIWAFGMWYAIDKYRLMTFTLDIAIDAILTGITDLFIMLNPQGRIIKINQPVERLLFYREKELIDKHITEILADRVLVEDSLKQITNGTLLNFEAEINFASSNKLLIPAKISGSRVKDKFGDFAGIVLIGHDLLQTRLLEKQNAELEAMQEDLSESNHFLAQKNLQLNNLFDNVGQGFLYFGPDLLIHADNSRECVNIFGENPAHQKISSLLYKGNMEEARFMDEVFSRVLEESDGDKAEIYLSLLPHEIGVNRTLINVQYKAVRDLVISGDHAILMILTDISEKRAMENQMEEEHHTLNMVVKTVINYETLLDCVYDFLDYYKYGIDEIILGEENLDSIVAENYRIIHTFKGNFSQFDASNTVRQLHNMETLIADEREKEGFKSKEEFILFLKQFDMPKWLNDDLAVLKSILGEEFFAQKNTISIERSRLSAIEEKMSRILPVQEYLLLLPDIRRLGYKSFMNMIRPYNSYVQKLAAKMDKLINPMKIYGDDVLVDNNYYRAFIKSLVHVFRNTVDHGIENMEERIEKGKDQAGTIKCRVALKEHNIILTITDDGKGVDFASLRERAVASEVYSLEEVWQQSESTLIDLIFREDFSTTRQVSLVSGRGIGLSAVKRETERINGKIKVNSRKDEGMEFVFELPFPALEHIPKSPWERILVTTAETARNFFGEKSNVFLQSQYKVSNEEAFLNNKYTVFVPLNGFIDIFIEGTIEMSFNEILAREVLKLFVVGQISDNNEECYIQDAIAECANMIVGNSMRNYGKVTDVLNIGIPSQSNGLELSKWMEPASLYCNMENGQYRLTIGISSNIGFKEEN